MSTDWIDIDATPPPPRYVGKINWLGLWTHYRKEVHRFLKVGFQTLVAPGVTTLLFLAVFSLALGRSVQHLGGVPFADALQAVRDEIAVELRGLHQELSPGFHAYPFPEGRPGDVRARS